MNRRGFLKGILAAGIAPAFVGSSILMPVRKLWTPPDEFWLPFSGRSFYMIGWTVSNDGTADITLQGLYDRDVYVAPERGVIIRPGESLSYDARTRSFNMKR